MKHNARYREFSEKVKVDALLQLSKGKLAPAAPDAMQQLLAKLEVVSNEILELVKPICQAGGAVKEQDREGAFRQMVLTLALERVHNLSKDELEVVVAITVSNSILAQVAQNPWQGVKPDLLS